MVSETEKKQRIGRGNHPNSKKNLKVFEKGESGNPLGNHKGTKHRGAIYERILKLQTPVILPNGKTVENVPLYEAIALGQAQSAMKGNTNAWKEIQDSIHGKIVDQSETKVTIEKIEVEFV